MSNISAIGGLILDDIMIEASKSLKITQLFTGCLHDNLSVIYLTQNLSHKNQRVLSLNSDYMEIFKNPRDNSQLATIARQIRMWQLTNNKINGIHKRCEEMGRHSTSTNENRKEKKTQTS